MSQELAFGRLIIPLVVPFKRNEDIDFEKLENLTEVQLDGDYCDALVIGGTTSEFPALAFEERGEIIRCVVDKVDKKVPVIAGTGFPSTRETIELTQRAEEIGADMAVVIVPYYQRPSQEGIYEHYKAVAESTSLPIMLYNMPFFTGVNIEPSTFKRLAQIKNIVGIKEEAGLNPLQITQFMNEAPDTFMFYDGDDSMILPVLVQGAIGAVAGGALVIGRHIKEMMGAFFAGDLKKAISMHHMITPFYKRVFGLRENPIPMIKEALHQKGIDVGVCRRPLVMADEREKKIINETLTQLKLV
ncbi:MAG: 4-hydroxy-tetrahydrodipicolinate synthase [Proteobacteria bacterium]|nr:4-hydroxy-tetrahydrodipicolinate synthase [Pseudomonadota bacterium]